MSARTKRPPRAPTPAADARRERILKVAERLFFEQGYARTTMEQIVRELGVTKPYVYYYFDSKQQIFELLSWRPTVACFTAMDFEPDDPRPPHLLLREGLRKLIRETLAHHPSAFFAYRDPQAYRPEYLAAQKRIAHHFYDRMGALLERARADGTARFRETRITALAACSIPGFLYSWYRPGGRLGPDELTDELLRLVERVIGLRTADDAGMV